MAEMNPSQEVNILEQIQALQSNGDQYFAKGIIPSTRSYLSSIKRKDNNIYFTSLVAFTILELYPLLYHDERTIVDDIVKKAIKNYPTYKNKKGLNTYNFWPTNPITFFPHGKLLSKISQFELPDDADCTAIIYLSSDISKNDITTLTNLLYKHATKSQKQYKAFPKAYQDYNTFTTFFGSEKMPIDHSIPVLCNILYLLIKHQAPIEKRELEAISIIKKSVENNDYINIPTEIGVYYATTPIILYHICRLISIDKSGLLTDIRPKLIADLKEIRQKNTSFMESILTESSAIRLGVNSNKDIKPIKPDQKHLIEYSFFMFSRLSFSRKAWIRKMARFKFTHVSFSSYAYNLTLILEYLVLQRRR